MLRRQRREKLYVTRLKHPAMRIAEQAATRLAIDCCRKARGNGWERGKKFVASNFKELSGSIFWAKVCNRYTDWYEHIEHPQRQRWEHVAGPAFMPGTQKLWIFQGKMHLQHLMGTAGEQKPPVWWAVVRKQDSSLQRVQLSWMTRVKRKPLAYVGSLTKVALLKFASLSSLEKKL